MPNLTGPVQLFSSDVFHVSTLQKHTLGAIGLTKDGRRFRYVCNGATLLVAGNVIQAPAQVANHQLLTPVAASIGATQVTAALGATAATLNQYAEGILTIGVTPGLGYSYGISGHQSVLSSGNITVNLFPEDALQVALTTSSRVTLQANPYNGVIQSPVTTLTSVVVGVAPYPIPASTSTVPQFGWIQTGGMCGVLIAGTPAVGQSVSAPSTAAGAAAINSGTLPIIGTMLQTGVDGDVIPVFLTID